MTSAVGGVCYITDAFRPPLRPVIDKPLRLCVTDVFKAMGAGVAVAGMIHTGSVQVGDRVIAVPAGETAVVKGFQANYSSCFVYFHVENVQTFDKIYEPMKCECCN